MAIKPLARAFRQQDGATEELFIYYNVPRRTVQFRFMKLGVGSPQFIKALSLKNPQVPQFFNPGWSRVEFFADSPAHRDKPRLAFDTLPRGLSHRQTGFPKSAWGRGRVQSRQDAYQTGEFLETEDTTCIYYRDSGSRQYLVANLVTANFLAQDNGLTTWQLVVDLGPSGRIETDSFWDSKSRFCQDTNLPCTTGDLVLREFLCCNYPQASAQELGLFKLSESRRSQLGDSHTKVKRINAGWLFQPSTTTRNPDAERALPFPVKQFWPEEREALLPDSDIILDQGQGFESHFPVASENHTSQEFHGYRTFLPHKDDNHCLRPRDYFSFSEEKTETEGCTYSKVSFPLAVESYVGTATYDETLKHHDFRWRAFIFGWPNVAEFREWYRRCYLAPVLEGSQTIESHAPASFLPWFLLDATNDDTDVVELAATFGLSISREELHSTTPVIPLQPQVTKAVICPANPTKVFQIAFPGVSPISSSDERPLSQILPSASSFRTLDSFPIQGPSLQFKLEFASRDEVEQNAMVGSFDFKSAAHHLKNIAFTGVLRATDDVGAPTLKLTADWKEVDLKVAALDAIPGESHTDLNRDWYSREDREGLADVERPLPLLVNLRNQAESVNLKIQEAVVRGQSHNIRIGVQRVHNADKADPDASGSDTAELLIIDPAPFGVYLAQTRTLKSLADGSGRELAVWSKEELTGGSWRLILPENEIDLILPPQGVGETADWMREVPKLRAGERAQARFSPQAKITLGGSFRPREFQTAPWNIRHLFGTPEQRLPGSSLKGFELELLYGLHGKTRDLRGWMLAEIGSRLGRVLRTRPTWGWPSDRLPTGGKEESQHELWEQARGQWQETRKRLWTRLALLETYRIDGQPPKFEDVEWRLRQTADLKDPVGVDPDLGFFNEQGLPGGVTWGFGSINILEAVLENPISDSGSLENLTFSAYGGGGKVEASFDFGRTTIKAEVRDGRTHQYSVTRLGRIGVCWNRAKHVVVFERTVAPSRQFDGIERDLEDRHLGRPILRRVQEYIELLEEFREFGTGEVPQHLRSFLLGAQFHGKRIPVKTEWGEDVGDIGWKVPLSDPFERKVNSDQYPHPHISFHVQGDPELHPSPLHATLKEPEKLYFYTDTRPPETPQKADPEFWESVQSVDFGHASASAYGTDLAPAQPGGLDKSVPALNGGAPGLDQFTYEVDLGGQPVNLVQGRAEGSVLVDLRNLTLMRSLELDPENQESAHKAFRDGASVLEEVDRLLQDLRSVDLNAVGAPEQLRDKVKAHETKLKSVLENIKASYGNITENWNPCKALRTSVEKSFSRWTAATLADVERLEGNVNTKLERLHGVVTTARQKLKTELGQPIIKKDDLLRLLKPLKDILREQRERIEDELDNFSELITRFPGRATTPLVAHLRPVRELLGTAPAAIGRALQPAFTLLHQVRTEIKQSDDDWLTEDFERALSYHQRLQHTLLRAAEGVAKLERVGAKKGRRIGALLDKLLAELRKFRVAINAARTRSNAIMQSILSFRGRVQTGRKEAVQALLDQLNSLQSKLTTFQTTIKGELALLEAKVQKLSNSLESGFAGVDAVQNELIVPLKERVEAFKADLPSRHIETVLTLIGTDAYLDSLSLDLLKTLAQKVSDEENWPEALRQRPIVVSIKEPLEKRIKPVEALFVKAQNVCNSWSGRLVDWLEDNFDIDDLIARVKGLFPDTADLEKLEEAIENIAEELSQDARRVYEDTRQAIEESVDKELFQKGNSALRLARAFGSPPKLPQLDFNRAAVAYVFGNTKDPVNMTPAVAWLNQANDEMKALGVRLPVNKISESLDFGSLKGDLLKGFKFNSFLPDLGGLKLELLFKDLSMPKNLKDVVKLRHGLDKQRKKAWAEASVNVELEKPKKVFSYGPVEMRLAGGKLRGQQKLESDIGGRVTRQGWGELWGEWQIRFGGQELVKIKDTTLRMDQNGSFKFDVSPNRVEFPGAVKYLSDLTKSYQFDKPDLPFKLLKRNGIPYGIEAGFDIAIPPVQVGTTGIKDATFSTGMRLEVYPEFAVEVDLNVSRRHSPFIFSIFILGGAGFLETRARYVPRTEAISADVSIGISASGSVGFEFGILTGSVSMAFGSSVEYHKRAGGADHLRLGSQALITGRCNIGFFATLDLRLFLQVRYTGSNTLTGDGFVSAKIRVSKFFKFEVRENVQYELSKGKVPGLKSLSSLTKENAGPETASAEDEQSKTHPVWDGVVDLVELGA